MITRNVLSRRVRTLLACALLVSIGAAPSAVDAKDAHATLRGFYPTGEFDLVMDGAKAEAQIYHSSRAAAYLIAPANADRLYVLLQRQRTVSSAPTTVLVQENGDVDLPADVQLTAIGKLRLAGTDVVIEAPSFRGVLKPRPPILGLKTGSEVLAHSPQYGLVARAYRPDETALAALRNASGTVEVLFGSWCPRCQQTMGNVLRIEQELGGRGPAFRYYGLPAPPEAWKDARFLESGVKALPAALVFAGRQLAARVPPAEWKHMERALAAALKGK